jgi:hypothetical protein
MQQNKDQTFFADAFIAGTKQGLWLHISQNPHGMKLFERHSG